MWSASGHEDHVFLMRPGILLNAAAAAAEADNNNNNNINSAAANSKSHSEAERRRRKRINGHLSTLRSLLPNTIKPDKASLLAEVVRSIREMKSVAAEMAGNNEIVPSETDELKLCYCGAGNDHSLIKVAISCDERRGLMGELAGAVRAAEGRLVRAEMATVGERTKNLLWVEMGGAGEGGGEERVSVLRRAVRMGLDRAAAVCQVLPDNKRTRLSQC